jgi:hypothetical protein
MFSTLLLVCTLSFSALAHDHEKPRNANEEIKEKIVKLIDHPDLSKLTGEKFHAEIEFMVTRHNQILVLAVYTDDEYFDRYVKNKLNYRAMNLKGVQKMIPYRLTVNFVQP